MPSKSESQSESQSESKSATISESDSEIVTQKIPMGILFVNLGTPNGSEVKDIKIYLREFLMDPLVINISFILRWILVNLIIVPFRSKKSAAKYQSIWTPEGSPLLVYSKNFAQKMNLLINKKKGSSFTSTIPVELAMRYGSPSLLKKLDKLKNCEKIVLIPLFPQFAMATTGSVLAKVQQWTQKQKNPALIKSINFFCLEDFFISSCADRIKKSVDWSQTQHLVFSYHGLPKNQITQNPQCRLQSSCCEPPPAQCYYAQSLATSKKIAKALDLNPSQWSTSFQSRLGRAEWLRPYTDDVIKELAQKGLTSMAIFSPSFVVDCLETLEELEIENKHAFLEAGGKSFTYIPCLNTDEEWMERFSDWLLKNL